MRRRLVRLASGVGQWALVALAVLALFALVSWMDGGKNVGLGALVHGSLGPWLNVLPSLLLMFVLLALTRKLALSLWLAALTTAILYAISSVKLSVLAAPLMRQDFLLAGQVAADGSLFARYIPWSASLVAELVAAVLITLALAVFEPSLLRARKRLRLPLAAVALLLLVTLVASFSPWKRLYAASALRYLPWETADRMNARFGLVGNLMLQGLFAPSSAPLVSNPQPGRALYDRHVNALATLMDSPTAERLPDIIVVQSESFFDPASMNGYVAGDWIVHFRQLERAGQHGLMRVPTYGGGTIRTEFEVLTGLALAFFPHMRYPYLALNEEHIPGLAQALKSMGYRTLAIHPNSGGFWDRRSIFRRMGFDHFIAAESPAFHGVLRRGYYPSDKAFTNVILGQLQPSGPPQFIFAISMENHGPYYSAPIAKDRQAEHDAIPVPSGVNKHGTQILQTYLLRQRDADAQLGRLAAALAKRQRPSILVFYGDHLPGLKDGYSQGFKNGKPANKQRVPYLLIWPGRSRANQRVDLPSWMLASAILEQAGVHDDPWFALEQLLAPRWKAVGWNLDAKQKRALASLANLRLHEDLPPVPKPATRAAVKSL